LSKDKVTNKLITQEIDFSSSYGIHRDQSDMENFHGRENGIVFEKIKQLSVNSKTSNDPKLYNSLPKQDETKILNILNAANLWSLIDNESILKILQDNFAKNVIIVNNFKRNLNHQLMVKGIIVKMNLVGKNVLIRLLDDDIILFETIVEKSRLFVEWRPVL